MKTFPLAGPRDLSVRLDRSDKDTVTVELGGYDASGQAQVYRLGFDLPPAGPESRPDTKPVEPEEPKPEEPKEAPVGQVCEALKNLHMVDVIEPNQAKAKNSAEIKNGTSTQSVKQKARFDVVPVLPGGQETTGGDATVNGPTFHKQDDANNGKSPIIEYKWTVDGKEASNSAEMEDPFELGSYEDNGGCTPTLTLVTPVGSGRHEVKMFAFIRPEYNGGVGVQSNTITWYCD